MCSRRSVKAANWVSQAATRSPSGLPIHVNAHRSEYAYIATTQDWHIEPGAHWSAEPDFVDTWPKHGAAGTLNAELHPAIKALNIEHHFKKGQYSWAYSGFEGIEDNTDRIQTREEVEAEQSAGRRWPTR